MPKTVIEKVPSSHSGVKVLKIGGTLGFHEKETLARLLHECEKRGIAKLVIDFSSLTSLGGGCAGILRDAANAGAISIGVAGASETTLKFLQKTGESCRIQFAPTIEEVISSLNGSMGGEKVASELRREAPRTEYEKKEAKADAQVDGMYRGKSKAGRRLEEAVFRGRQDSEEVDESQGEGANQQSTNESAEAYRLTGESQSLPKVIYLGHDGNVPPADSPGSPHAASAVGEDPTSLADSMDVIQVDDARKVKSSSSRLAKKLFHYDALLSISSEFNRLSDIGRLLDTFLLTTMAQVGVEHAAFFELKENIMTPIAARGIELSKCVPFERTDSLWSEGSGKEKLEIIEFAELPAGEDIKDRLRKLGFFWAAPFLVYGELRGVVLLGRPIKKMLDEDSFEVLKILVHHASIAYENRRRFEEINYQSLGLIQTIISLIEEKNNLVGGSTFFAANYSFITAKKMNYPMENISDLMFGVVLRDIGMIKVSDLILKNPRELNNEEWEIIKQHPIDGAEMLKKMRFSDHTVEIVLHHHERFNGEGYPNNLRGSEIPLGARIVSVVESFGAMLQERPTRPALSQEEALNAIKENWGLRYDPEVVRNFVEIIEEEIRTGERERYTDNELFKHRG